MMNTHTSHSLLARVTSPVELRQLSPEQLVQLAAEIREFLIYTISATGGHLASNLGIVELTIALHRVFETPRDRLVFDTGHQGYVHKILTGRADRMATIRQHGGLSGFLKREESEYDTFGAGHAGTAISAAYGMAVARDLAGEDHHVVAVVGDASLTAGMAFEALNHAGDSKRDFVVVLNDNRMSIAENVGALKRYFNRIIRAPFYNRFKHELDDLLAELPPILGTHLLHLLNRVREGVKGVIVPGLLFEELGFRYFGPVDGHDIRQLCRVLSDIRSLRGEPRLVHVITEKGRGYSPAIAAPDKFHGVSPFDVETGLTAKRPSPPSYTQVFAHTLIQLAEKDPRIVAITAAMPQGTGLDAFAQAYPERFFDVGIAEQHAVTFAAGLSTAGYKPVCAIYSTFLQRAFDQVLHDVAIQNLDVTLALDRGGIVGDDGETHQGIFDLSYLRLVPNLVIAAPKDENELQHLLATVIDYNGPAAIRYPRGCGLGVPRDLQVRTLPIGTAEVLVEGNDVVLIGLGSTVATTVAVGERLRADGYSVAVVNARFAKPLDEDILVALAQTTGRIVTVEENVLAGGFGSAVGELLRCAGVGTRVDHLAIGLPDRFIEHGSQGILREKYGLSVDGICAQVSTWLRGAVNRRVLIATHNKPQKHTLSVVRNP